MANSRIRSLETKVSQLEIDKMELIRSTSTEIERLRTMIRNLTDPSANLDDLYALTYTPMSLSEKNRLSPSDNILNPVNPLGPIHSTNILPNLSPTTPSGHSNMRSQEVTMSTIDPVLPTQDITVEKWPPPNTQQPRSGNLASLREEKSYSYDDDHIASTDKAAANKRHEKKDTLFRLNTKRMSYKGFEFGDFGFMTTDFDQLSRGHTQWVNQVLHHPLQNGIVITASDDWCVMFWRFKKSLGNEELKQEQLSSKTNKQKMTHQATPHSPHSFYTDPKLQHIQGEIELLPVLKINTGLEVKGVALSGDGQVLACTCYDEEEDEGNPELQLYIDRRQNWRFKHHQFSPYYGSLSNKDRRESSQHMSSLFADNDKPTGAPSPSGERVISRRIVALPFEPIPHCVCFSRDNKYVFVAMYSSVNILRELREEQVAEYGDWDQLDSEQKTKWPDHPVSLCCVDIEKQTVTECERIWKYLRDDEHVSCMAISPNGARIAVGTSLGQLIVTGVLNLTGDIDKHNEGDFSEIMTKLWSSEDSRKMRQGMNNFGNTENDPDYDEDPDGSVTAIDWSPDSKWVVCGLASGAIKFWKEMPANRRLSAQLNRTLKKWMGAAQVSRKQKLFSCKHYLEGIHIEATNSLSICGSLMVSGADDGNVVIHDLLETFVDSNDAVDCSPLVLGRVDKIHGGRMVNSVCLSSNYAEDNILVPSTGYFMVTSGADNIVHCVSLMDIFRQTIRNQHIAKSVASDL